MKPPILHTIRFRDGAPAIARQELNEALPPQADMCRYDLAFIHPADPSLALLPIFQSRHGRTSAGITHRRWESFGLRVERLTLEGYSVTDLMSFVTYRSTGQSFALKPVTLYEYMTENQFQIAGWRVSNL